MNNLKINIKNILNLSKFITQNKKAANIIEHIDTPGSLYQIIQSNKFLHKAFIDSIFFILINLANLQNSILSIKDQNCDNSLLKKSAINSCESIFGVVGGNSIDFFPFLTFFLNKKTEILSITKHKLNIKEKIFINFLLMAISLPISLTIFEILQNLNIIKDNFFLKHFTLITRQFLITSILIIFGILFHMSFNIIENKIEENIKPKLENKYFFKALIRLTISSIFVIPTYIYGGKLRDLTINYLSNKSLNTEMILLIKNIFNSWIIVFSIYCIIARSLVLLYKSYIDSKSIDEKEEYFKSIKNFLIFFATCVISFYIKNFIEKYQIQYLTDAFLGLAIMSNIMFAYLIFQYNVYTIKSDVIMHLKQDNILNKLDLKSSIWNNIFIMLTILTPLIFININDSMKFFDNKYIDYLSELFKISTPIVFLALTHLIINTAINGYYENVINNINNSNCIKKIENILDDNIKNKNDNSYILIDLSDNEYLTFCKTY